MESKGAGQRVGILTFHNGHNPGAFLQAWCLQEQIRRLGYTPEVIDYVSSFQAAALRRSWRPKRRPWLYFANRNKWNRYRETFSRFTLSNPIASDQELETLGDFHSVVYGSDEIWNVNNVTTGLDLSFWGAGPKQWKRVSYAPSVGAITDSNLISKPAAELLNRFSALSVRDANSQQVIEALSGRRPELVVDPTMLIDLPTEPINRDFSDVALVYMNPMRGPAVEAVKRWADQNRLSLHSIFYKQRWCQTHTDEQDPLKILDAFRQAKIVITNTFHGSMFSIAHQRPFINITGALKRLKTESVLRSFGLGDRCTDAPDQIANILDQPIDYGPVREKILSMRESSQQFLSSALANDGSEQ